MKPTPGPTWSKAPAEWGSAVPYDAWKDKWYPREGIAIHHGGGGDYPAHKPPYSIGKEAQQLRQWEQYHLNRGWRGIAYNWAVGMTGTVYRLRGWNVSGAHTGDIDQDGFPNGQEILAVLFIMSGSRVAPSAAMLAGFEKLRGYLEGEAGPLYLWGHKEVQPSDPTSCPGKLVMPYVQDHRHSTGIVKPSDEIVDYLVAEGIVGPPADYWKQLPAGDEDWWRFNAAAQNETFIRAAFASGQATPNEEWAIQYWLTVAPDDLAEWGKFWAAVRVAP